MYFKKFVLLELIELMLVRINRRVRVMFSEEYMNDKYVLFLSVRNELPWFLVRGRAVVRDR